MYMLSRFNIGDKGLTPYVFIFKITVVSCRVVYVLCHTHTHKGEKKEHHRSDYTNVQCPFTASSPSLRWHGDRGGLVPTFIGGSCTHIHILHYAIMSPFISMFRDAPIT